ncbi:MAG: KaiC 1, partial [Acidobacteria bacterium]|nr:KaiC 1 [Acidobacteriota bacterium]
VRKAYLGETGMLTGSARMAEEAREASRALAENQEIERKQLLLARKRKALEAQIAALELEMEAGEQESRQIATQEETRRREGDRARQEIARSRHTMATPAANGRADRPKGGRK